jgi:hypothetical protein
LLARADPVLPWNRTGKSLSPANYRYALYLDDLTGPQFFDVIDGGP